MIYIHVDNLLYVLGTRWDVSPWGCDRARVWCKWLHPHQRQPCGGGQGRVAHTNLTPHLIDSRAPCQASQLPQVPSCRCSRCGSFTEALIESKTATARTRCQVSPLTRASRCCCARCGSFSKALSACYRWSKAIATHSRARCWASPQTRGSCLCCAQRSSLIQALIAKFQWSKAEARLRALLSRTLAKRVAS